MQPLFLRAIIFKDNLEILEVSRMEKTRKNCEPVELYSSTKDSRIEKIIKRVS